MSQDAFRTALSLLSNDSNFRNAAISTPQKLISTFNLTGEELEALATMARVSGADVSNVDPLFAGGAGEGIGNITTTCCCCCCCGTEGIVVYID